MEQNQKYVFIGKTLFFPKERVLVVGDLHLGYEEALRQRGLEIPINQFKEVTEELEKTIENIRARYGKIEEIIFLGDIKHHFNYLATEREGLRRLISFLRKFGIEENHVIFIRGNHEKNEKNGKYCDFYILKDIVFVHGHKDFLELYDKKINLIIMGHIHPTVTLSDEMKVKVEKFKCFLVGRHKNKDFVVLPSFISLTEGVNVGEFDENERDFSIVPQSELMNFDVYVASEPGEEALCFGKLKSIK